MTKGCVLLFTLKLLFVEEIQETDCMMLVKFEGKREAQLTKYDGDKCAKDLEHIRYGFKHGHPVGVTMEKSGRIVTVESADSDTVAHLEEQDSKRLLVFFQGHAAPYYLSKEHPDFGRVRAVLEQSAKDEIQVWLSFQLPQMMVADARLPRKPREDKKEEKEQNEKGLTRPENGS